MENNKILYKAKIKLKKEIWNGVKKIKSGEKFVDDKCFDGKYHPDTAEVEKLALSEKELQEKKEAEEAQEAGLKKEKDLKKREDDLKKREEAFELKESKAKEAKVKKEADLMKPKEAPKNQNMNSSFPSKK